MIITTEPGWNPQAALSDPQREKLAAYEKLLLDWNQKLNLVSRRSAEHFQTAHLLHSLALTYHRFPNGCTVADFGTGGGLPGLPLAIVFPDVQFVLIDSIAKKMRAVQDMAAELKLSNVTVWNGRAESWTGKAHYAVSRATAPLLDLWHWHARARTPWKKPVREGTWTPGLVALKGGDLDAEIAAMQRAFPKTRAEMQPLAPLLADEFYTDKYIVYVTD